MTSPPPDEEWDESLEDIRQDEESAARPAQLYYANVVEFVTEQLAPTVARPTPDSGRVWCPRWFAHAEAIARLEALWRAWEYSRYDAALGISNWFTHHLDPHLRALLDPVTGPFARCVDGHQRHEPLPLEPAPEGMFEKYPWSPPSNDLFALD